ncbi:MAG: hypothetical protein ACO4AI_09585, partial [Prochlorothrix sp.]
PPPPPPNPTLHLSEPKYLGDGPRKAQDSGWAERSRSPTPVIAVSTAADPRYSAWSKGSCWAKNC